MAIRMDDLQSLFERLNEEDQKTVIDFMQYLIDRSDKKPSAWKAIEAEEPDNIPLNEEEKMQLESDDEYISWEQAKNELRI